MYRFLLLLAFSTNFCLFAQQRLFCENSTITFEDDFCLKNITIDSIQNPNNIWAIGSPNKHLFNSGISSSNNVIVTDTAHPYPINDTSSFTFSGYGSDGFTWPQNADIFGYYNINSDSLNDYGEIEFSPDNGTTWINLLTDTIYNSYYYWSSKPILTGNSNGWKYFSVDLANFGPYFNIQDYDTIMLRFTFISDSIPDTLDGLMFDDFYYNNYVQNLNDIDKSKKLVQAFPNPTTSDINFQLVNFKHSPINLMIYDITGCLAISKTLSYEPIISLNTKTLSAGSYYYTMRNMNDQQSYYGRFELIK